jgi:hypothetical protein
MAEPTKKLQPADKNGPPMYVHPSRDPNAPAPNLHTKPATIKNLKRPAATPDGPKPQAAYLSEQQPPQDAAGA